MKFVPPTLSLRMDSTDPGLNRFLMQLQAETQKQKFTEQVSTVIIRFPVVYWYRGAFTRCLGSNANGSVLGRVLHGLPPAEQNGRKAADVRDKLRKPDDRRLEFHGGTPAED